MSDEVRFESEGMEDLGNLPMITVAIRNVRNGEITRQSDYVYEGGPGMEAWAMVVRFASAHQKDYEFLESEKPAKGDKDTIKLPDGSPVTLANLKKLHHKTLLKFAKDMNVETKDQTPLQIQEKVLAAVNTKNQEA